MNILLSIFCLFILIAISKIITGRYFSPATIIPIQWLLLLVVAYLSKYWYIENATFYIISFNILYCIGFYSLYLSSFSKIESAKYELSRSLFFLSLFITSSVDIPIEPVEPSIAIFFFILKYMSNF